MKTKITGIIAIILAVLLIKDVYAYQAYEGIFYEAEKIDGIYFYKHLKKTTNESEEHDFYSQATIYKKSTDNNIVYSTNSLEKVEYFQEHNYLIMNQDYPDNWNYRNADRVVALAYYGYGYKKDGYDHTDSKWYAITQYLIWETISTGVEHYFTESLFSKTPIYPFEREIAELNDLVSSHITKPLIEDYNNKKNMVVGQTIVVKDTIDTLKNYQRIVGDGLNVEKISNTELKITALKEGNNSVFLYQTYNYYKKTHVYYSSGESQYIIEPGNILTRRDCLSFYTTESIKTDDEDLKEDGNKEEQPKEDETNQKEKPTRPSLEEKTEDENISSNNDDIVDTGNKDETEEKDGFIDSGEHDESKGESEEEKKESSDENKEDKESTEDQEKDECLFVDNENNQEKDKTENKEISSPLIEPEKNQEFIENDSNPNFSNEIIIDNLANTKDKNSIIEIATFEKEKLENPSNIKSKDKTSLVTLEKSECPDNSVLNLESSYEPVETKVLESNTSILSLIFYLLSTLGLLFIHRACKRI